jgi:hypothetical protein
VTGLTRARRLLLYAALMSMGMGALASCAKAPAPPPPAVAALPSPLPPPQAPPLARRWFPVPERKPAPPPLDDTTQGTGGAANVAMAEPGPTVNSPPSPAPQVSELVGLDQPAATHLFGAATEQSSVPPATVWRYRNATCELDLFFYLDLRSGKMRALHYTFKGDDADPGGQQDCLRSLVVARGSYSRF